MADEARRDEGMSAELDELSSELMGEALDRLADEGSMGVMLVVETADGEVELFEFVDDGAEQMLEGARDHVKSLVRLGQAKESALPVRYAIAYEGAVDTGEGYEDALLLEFGERGWPAFSAFSLVSGKGTGDGFAWTDPAPAGEVEPLL